MWHNLWYDEKEKSIRGSFINLSITILYMVLIITGSFVSFVAANLREMETLLIGVFVSSFGLWAGKKSVEFIKKMGIDTVLQKSGLNLDDLNEAGTILREKRTNGTAIKTSNDDSEQRRREREAAK
jgi:uncharacterized membrane protein